jgi:hypothetical protein
MLKKASDILFSNAIRAMQKQQDSSDYIQRLTE